jgi:hypothetical protein
MRISDKARWKIGGGLAAVLMGCAALSGPSRAQNAAVEPDLTIWDVKLGAPVTDIPDKAVATLACGTDGGPVSIPLKRFADWRQCTPEPSGLRELAFTYDDEKGYIARALEIEFRALAAGTSVYAHPVVLSVLVDDKGLAQGIRIVTDDRASDHDRRLAVTLSRNFQARFGRWRLACQDIPMQPGEQKVGDEFTHQRCTGENPDGSGQKVLIEASYMRKKGQEAMNRDTQRINKGYYQSQTRLELLNPPYLPSEAP